MGINTERAFSIKYNRWVWAHWPFGDDLGKAKDPYIRVKTLVRISQAEEYSEPVPFNVQIHQAIARNIIDRFKRGAGLEELREAIQWGRFDTLTEKAIFEEDDCPTGLLAAFLGAHWIQQMILKAVVAHKNAPEGAVIISFCKKTLFRALHDKECSAIIIPDEECEALERFPEYAYAVSLKRIYPERQKARLHVMTILDNAKHLTTEERKELEQLLKDAPPGEEAVPANDPKRKQLRDEIRKSSSRKATISHFS